MPLRLSKGLRNFLNEGGSLKQAFAGGKIELYTGTQPASADDAVSGTLLCVYTDNSGAHTAEVQATGSVELTGGGAGSVDTVTVNSIEIMGSSTAFNSSLAQTAADVANKINNNPKNMLYMASVPSGSIIQIKARPGLGTLPNTWVVASTVTTITKTDTNMSGGVNSANGLKFGDSANGALVKDAAQTWSGVGLAPGGTAGYFRFKGAVSDAGSADSAELYFRLDGSVSTSGANLNLSSTSIVTSATQSISAWTLTEPAS